MRLFTFCLFLVAIAVPVTSANAVCYSPREYRASQVRQLQAELMVAALSCSRHPQLEFPHKYNAFVRRFGPDLKENAEVLRGHFGRHYGTRREAAFDAFITRLANEASSRAMAVEDYCRASAPLFDKVLALGTGDLESFAAGAVAKVRGVEVCAR